MGLRLPKKTKTSFKVLWTLQIELVTTDYGGQIVRVWNLKHNWENQPKMHICFLSFSFALTLHSVGLSAALSAVTQPVGTRLQQTIDEKRSACKKTTNIARSYGKLLIIIKNKKKRSEMQSNYPPVKRASTRPAIVFMLVFIYSLFILFSL